jgi:hypothetical protein
LVLDHVADEPRAVLTQPVQRVVEVVDGKHDTQVAERVHRRVPVIRHDRRREKPGELEAAVAVRRPHHGDLDALIAEARHASGPRSFDRRPPFELEAKLAKEVDRRGEVLDDDPDVVHPCERHVSNLQASHRVHLAYAGFRNDKARIGSCGDDSTRGG